MKPIFKEVCHECSKGYDPLLGKCPKCGERGTFFDLEPKYRNHSRIGFGRNIALFLVGLFGLEILAIFAAIGAIIHCITSYSDSMGIPFETYREQYINSTEYLMISNVLCYVILLIIFLLICLGTYKELFKSFKRLKSFYKGIGYFLIAIAASMIWGFITQLIDPSSEENLNQSMLEMIIKDYPVISLIAFGLIGPFTEELTYRVGLFSFASRINKIFAYIITLVVFGLIHFDFNCLEKGTLLNELLQLPSYCIAGFVFSYAYDKDGLAASFTGHALNNLIAIGVIILGI